MNTYVVGPLQWALLEEFGRLVDQGLLDPQQFCRYIRTLAQVFPCIKCRTSLASYLELYGTNLVVQREALQWVYDLHSFVNYKLGRTQVQDYLSFERFSKRMEIWQDLTSLNNMQDWCILVTLNVVRKNGIQSAIPWAMANQILVHVALLLQLGKAKGWLHSKEVEAKCSLLTSRLTSVKVQHTEGIPARALLSIVHEAAFIKEPLNSQLKRLELAVVR